MSPALQAALARLGRRRGRFLFLDFDGTLSPIVSRPSAARVDPRVPPLLERLLRQSAKVAIVTGRALDDIRRRIAVPGLIYAAVHGLVIDDGRNRMVPAEARETAPRIRRLAAELGQKVGDVPGVEIEDKGLTVAVHVRRAAPADAVRVRALALTLAEATPGIRAVEGKRVVELRPDIDWDKGRAVQMLLDGLAGKDWRERAGVLYVGDDRTDEDVFAVLPEEAVTVRVGHPDEPTAARFVVPDTEAVVEILRSLTAPPAD